MTQVSSQYLNFHDHGYHLHWIYLLKYHHRLHQKSLRLVNQNVNGFLHFHWGCGLQTTNQESPGQKVQIFPICTYMHAGIMN